MTDEQQNSRHADHCDVMTRIGGTCNCGAEVRAVREQQNSEATAERMVTPEDLERQARTSEEPLSTYHLNKAAEALREANRSDSGWMRGEEVKNLLQLERKRGDYLAEKALAFEEENRRKDQTIADLREVITDVLHGSKMDRAGNRNDDGMDMARIAKNLHYPDWWYDRLDAALSRLANWPEGEVVVTTNENVDAVAVTRQDSEGRILSVIWEREDKR